MPSRRGLAPVPQAEDVVIIEGGEDRVTGLLFHGSFDSLAEMVAARRVTPFLRWRLSVARR